LTSPHPVSRQRQGLQAERTALAWTRTSFAVLANGALLMVRHLHSNPGPLKTAAAALAVVLALSTYLIGVRRQRTLSRRPLPRQIVPRHEVHLLAASVLVLILVSALSLAV
jgi:uncharacterized membrane protein YidH (DUF202 family)